MICHKYLRWTISIYSSAAVTGETDSTQTTNVLEQMRVIKTVVCTVSCSYSIKYHLVELLWLSADTFPVNNELRKIRHSYYTVHLEIVGFAR